MYAKQYKQNQNVFDSAKVVNNSLLQDQYYIAGKTLNKILIIARIYSGTVLHT